MYAYFFLKYNADIFKIFASDEDENEDERATQKKASKKSSVYTEHRTPKSKKFGVHRTPNTEQ